MKHLIILFLLSVFSVSGQISTFELPQNPDVLHCEGEVIKATATQSGIRFFVKYSCEGSKRISSDGFQLVGSKNPDMPFTIIRVLDYDHKRQLIASNKYLLDSPAFTLSGSAGSSMADVMAESKDLTTYSQLLKKYPELSSIEYLDQYNVLMPDTYYKSQVISSRQTGAIRGFRSRKFIIGNNGSTGKEYTSTDKVKMDWSESFHGPQDRDNYWTNYSSYSCPATGKVILLSGRKKMEDRLNQHKEIGIFLISPDGNITKKHAFNFDKPWMPFDSKSYYYAENAHNTLGFHYVLARQNSSQNNNPEANLKLIKFLALDNEANIILNENIETDIRISNIDSLLVFEDASCLALKTDRDNAVVMFITPQHSNYYNIDLTTLFDTPFENAIISDVHRSQNQISLALKIYSMEKKLAGIALLSLDQGEVVTSKLLPPHSQLIAGKSDFSFISDNGLIPIGIHKQYIVHKQANIPVYKTDYYYFEPGDKLNIKKPESKDLKFYTTQTKLSEVKALAYYFNNKFYSIAGSIKKNASGEFVPVAHICEIKP